MFVTLAWVLGVDVLALRGIASEVEDHLWPVYERFCRRRGPSLHSFRKHLYRVPATKPTPANPLPAAADHVAPHADPRSG